MYVCSGGVRLCTERTRVEIKMIKVSLDQWKSNNIPARNIPSLSHFKGTRT